MITKVMKCPHKGFTPQTSVNLNLTLRQGSPFEQRLRHKQIVFQSPACTLVTSSSGNKLGFKAPHRDVMRSGTPAGLGGHRTHLNDAHLPRLNGEHHSCVLFVTASTGIQSACRTPRSSCSQRCIPKIPKVECLSRCGGGDTRIEPFCIINHQQ